MKFTLSLENILSLAHKEEEFEWPTLLRKPADERDMGKFCDYHRDHGHNTEQYRNLHYLLELMVRARRLRESLKRENCKPMETKPRAQNNPFPFIVAIFSSKPRRMIRQEPMPRGLVATVQYSLSAGSTQPINGVISLSNQDSRELEHPHEDALILALEMGKFLERRVLVDTGSIIDIMH